MAASVIARPSGREESRDKLLAAALDEFLLQGFQAARIEDIARRAGMGKGSVYLHFANKEDLFAAVIENGVAQRLGEAEHFAASFAGSATEMLSRMLHTNLVEFWDSNASGIYKLVIAESARFPQLAADYQRMITQRARALIEQTLQLGIDQGEYRKIDVACTARIILDALDNELVQAHAFPVQGDNFDAHRYLDTLLELVTRGVAREGAA